MLDLIFPPDCGGCGKFGFRWCEDCQQKVKILNGTLCEVCGLPQNKAGVCDVCRVERPHFHMLRAWCVFEEPVKTALHKLKYRRNISLGDPLAEQMSLFVRELNWPVDTIIPIPLSRGRKRERGYNQVGMVAWPLAMALKLEYAPAQLARCRETRSQVGLSQRERRVNVHQAFRADVGVRGKTILLMDDVSTTGSTLSSAAEALLLAGAQDVYALTVSRALRLEHA
jgi:competence protein ComFC